MSVPAERTFASAWPTLTEAFERYDMTEPVSLNSENLERPAKRSQEGGVGEILKVIVQALLIALVVRTLLFQPFNIPSGSLIPTLLIGDYLFVSKYTYGYFDHSFPFSPNLFPG